MPPYHGKTVGCTRVKLAAGFQEPKGDRYAGYSKREHPSKETQSFEDSRVEVISGKVDEARKVLDELTGFLQQGCAVQCDIALTYKGLGERERTLDWLEKALAAQRGLTPREAANRRR